MGSSTQDRGAPAQVVYEASSIMAEFRREQALEALPSIRYRGGPADPERGERVVREALHAARSRRFENKRGLPRVKPAAAAARKPYGHSLVTFADVDDPTPARPTDPITGRMVEPDLPLPTFVRE